MHLLDHAYAKQSKFVVGPAGNALHELKLQLNSGNRTQLIWPPPVPGEVVTHGSYHCPKSSSQSFTCTSRRNRCMLQKIQRRRKQERVRYIAPQDHSGLGVCSGLGICSGMRN